VKNGTRGFTLVELMIVVVILGILSAIAIPKFRDVSESAKTASCRSNMRTIAGALQLYRAEHNEYPPGNGWKTLNTISRYVHAGLLCPSTGLGYRYRIMGRERDTFSLRGWNANCWRNHGQFVEGVFEE
jgi:prepilin-type N-terminal cleavage/methylation domain-containing protein